MKSLLKGGVSGRTRRGFYFPTCYPSCDSEVTGANGENSDRFTRRPASSEVGFTLVELLVVIGVISVLAGLLLPVFSVARARSHRVRCMSNLRELMVGSILYSSDDRRGVFADTLHDGDDDSGWLFQRYISTGSIFVCPSFNNLVNVSEVYLNQRRSTLEPVDLISHAVKGGRGSAYEIFGFMGRGTGETSEVLDVDGWRTVAGVQKSTSSVGTYVHGNSSFELLGVTPGPSAIWLFLDASESRNTKWNNYPNQRDAHGDQGANVGFCDGHVDWITTKFYPFRYELSQDEGRDRP